MTLPHWDLSNVFPGLESPEFQAAFRQVSALLDEMDQYLDAHHISANGPPPAQAGEIVNAIIDRQNELIRIQETVRAYLFSFISTDSYNQIATRLWSEFQMLAARGVKQGTRFDGWLRGLANHQPPIWEYPGAASAHAFYLREALEQSRYLMSEAEEALAADLSLSGVNAWSKLQGTLTSQLMIPFERNGQTEPLPVPALQNLQRDSQAEVRRRAFEAELVAWATVREPLAAAMNGVKGSVGVLAKRRGRTDALHEPLDQARMDRSTLEAMMGAMHDSFPAFRKYLKAKAKRLGHETLPWWDLFAPIGDSRRTFTWPETQDFVVGQFRTFSDSLADFAQTAFDRNWIDAESRNGKRGGAFCMGVPAVHEPRVLVNFDGSLDQVFTVAHELGHGFHYMMQKGKTELQSGTPMTLAETASIFCETLMTEAALKQAQSPFEELTILETSLQGATQVIVDISSRFLFEREVFERRAQAELSADNLCEIMTRAQKATYGDALDPATLHPYMWAWKPHYYRAELQFYNFPYAFGLLFGLGLYAVYQQRGPAFVTDYENLLASTGEETPANLAARFGIDIRSRDFWANSLAVIGRRIERYTEL
jgi:pepF/M3 family oligoendopeptidase